MLHRQTDLTSRGLGILTEERVQQAREQRRIIADSKVRTAARNYRLALAAFDQAEAEGKPTIQLSYIVAELRSKLGGVTS